jgi:hypothetical protein
VIWQTEDTSGAGGEDVTCLYFEYFLFNATTGQEIQGHYELLMPGRSIFFYILNLDQFRQLNRSYCLYGWNGAAELHAYAPSFDIDWRVRETGEYAFVFLTTVYYGGYIQFKAQSITTTTWNTTITYTTTAPYALQITETEAYTWSATSAQTQPETQNNYLLTFVAIVIVLTIGVTIKKRYRHRTPISRHVVKLTLCVIDPLPEKLIFMVR